MAFTLTPFLYQTRTLQRVARAPSTVHALRYISTTSVHQAPRKKPAADPIPFELPPDLQSESPDKTREDGDRVPDGTITPSERQTFQRIFREIAQRSPQASQPQPRAFPDRKLTSKGESAVNLIIGDAAARFGQQNVGDGEFDPITSFEDAYSASAREEALLRFPPSLRKAARQALGVAQQDNQLDSKAFKSSLEAGKPSGTTTDDEHGLEEERFLDALADNRQIEIQREEMRTRVELLMRSASTDFELWDVLEAEVFPMVERLGIGERAMGQPVKQGGRRKQPKQTQAASHNAEAASDKLSIEVYGPLYPSFLLYALQLFDRHFAKPSRLCFSIMPRVKELGLASYVLGINLPFYNELMNIHWRRYGDANAVLSLLEEMRHGGLHFDRTSLDVVDAIHNFYRESFKGAKGQWRQALMSMPEFEPIVELKARQWVNFIWGRIVKLNKERAVVD